MMEIVGVVKDAKYVNLREANRSMVYVPFTQYPSQITEVEVRTVGDPAAAIANVRREIAAVDRRLPVLQAAEMRDQVDASIAAERLVANLSSAFGLLALTLAAVGLYGVIAFVSARRTAEIGIRMALGAQRAQVLWLVMKDALQMLAAGAALGLPAAWAASRLVSSLLFGLRAEDPSTIIVATAVLMGVGALAGFLPARRAARVDPMVALRHE
jgi:ABC-type antimicrobial peptide transport system permease subunit